MGTRLTSPARHPHRHAGQFSPIKSAKLIGSLGQGHTWSVQPSDTQAYLPRWSTSRSSDSHPHAPRTTCPSARGRRSHDPQTVPDLRPLDPSRTQSVTDINSSCRTDSSGGAAVHRRSRRSQSSCQSAQLFDERQRWSGREVPPLRPTWCGSCDEDRSPPGVTTAMRLRWPSGSRRCAGSAVSTRGVLQGGWTGGPGRRIAAGVAPHLRVADKIEFCLTSLAADAVGMSSALNHDGGPQPNDHACWWG